MSSLFDRVLCFPAQGFMFSLLGFHVFPAFWVMHTPKTVKWGKELRFEGLAKGEQRP